MGNTVTRNAFKGYAYQKWVYLNFVYKMDLDNKINYINAEIDRANAETTKFDDIILRDEQDYNYYVQVKDYGNFSIDKVSVEENKVKITGYEDIPFDSKDINIVVFQSNFECDDEILGIKAKCIDSVYFIPLTTEISQDQIGEYSDIYRKDSLERFIYGRLHNGQFKIYKKDLPPYNIYPIKLNKKTILLRKIPDEKDIKKGVHWCIGPPGIGKSHLVCEFEEKYENLIIYRFHTDNDDLFKEDRLVFSNFLRNLSYEIFKNASLHSKDEIIKRLEEIDKVFIIDGLDHVENYREDQFDEFIDFFECLKNIKTLIFSRPLKNYSNFKNHYVIRNWFENETHYFLNQEYNFLNDKFDEIYHLSMGYPIITFYLSEFVKNGGDLLEYSEPINSINEYYDGITKKIRYKNLLKIFLTVPSYILEDEIKNLLNPDYSEMLLEFIEDYPYLFIKELNRISLFHDSFNNYLSSNLGMNNKILESIKENILSKNIEFLSRFHTIDFKDDLFIKKVLKQFLNFETFKEISHNADFESVKIFYLNLKKILKNYPNTLDIYQYYSLILITMILERHDYHHVPELFYHVFYYFDRNNIDEKNIFSNGVLWSLYVYYKTNNPYLYEKLLENTFYDRKDLIRNLNEKWDEERLWSFNYKNSENIDEIKIQNYLRETHDYKLFEKYLAYIYIKNIKESQYYNLIYHYINNTFKHHHEEYLNDICIEFGFMYFKRNILRNAKIKIYERGCLKNENIFLNHDLINFMKCVPADLSVEIYNYLIGYMRLYNHLDINFDFEEIFKFLNMYYFRKDYSVVNLEKALLVFEKHDCIKECDSVRLIKNTMVKSEKGIRYLLCDYLNKKSPEFMFNINHYWDELEIHIDGLDYDKINNIELEHVARDLKYVLSSFVDFIDIKELLKSKYAKQILHIIKSENITISNVPKESTYFFEENNIPYGVMEINEMEEDKKRNYLVRDDFKNIKEQNIDYLKLSTCIDGYNHCLPFIEFFELYDSKYLRKDCLEIIYNALSTRERYFNKYPASWYLCLGNIPYLLDMIEYDVDWKKLFDILFNYLKQSSIYLKREKMEKI